MIIPPHKRDRSMDDSILPLINVVFLLLIFFVIAGIITRAAPFQLTLPATQQAATQTTPAKHILSIAADGRLAFDETVITPSELSTALADWPANRTLQVRADAALPVDKLNQVLHRLRKAGIPEIRLLTQHHS